MSVLAPQDLPLSMQTVAPPTRRTALARLVVLLRTHRRLCESLLHVVRGAVTCAVVFPFVDAGARRRHITQWTHRMLAVLGVDLIVHGSAETGRVLVCANHLSWLDILAIQAILPARFVSKAEVRCWPLIGRLAAAAGTLFVERRHRRDAVRVVHEIAAALSAGGSVAVFPEGTTGNGRVLLPFHANLLQAAIAAQASVQPVALRFSDGRDAFSPAAPFVGDMTLIRSLLRIAAADGLTAHLTRLPVIEAACHDRRTLAAATRARIQRVLDGASERADCR